MIALAFLIIGVGLAVYGNARMGSFETTAEKSADYAFIVIVGVVMAFIGLCIAVLT